jgi:type VI secretion system secreted protein Hcp
MAIYLKIPSTSGNVTTEGFKNWIEVSDIEFSGVSAPVNMQIGNSINRNSSRPKFGEVTIIKNQDQSSNVLFDAVHSGQSFDQVEFNYTSTGSQSVVYGKLILTNAMVTHYSDSHHGDAQGTPQEIVRFAYTKMQRTVVPRDATNKPGSPNSAGYDLEKATKI